MSAASTIQMIPLSRLRRSPENVRTVSADNAADKELIASIREVGLLQNLVVRRWPILPPPADRPEDQIYEVPAGGRRLGAMQYLVESGAWDAGRDRAQAPPCAGTEQVLAQHARFNTDWLTKPTVAEQFQTFLDLEPNEPTEQAAWAIGHLMQPDDFAQIAEPLSRSLAENGSPIEIRRAWTPDESYFGRLKKDRLLEIGRDLFGDAWHAEHAGWKKGALVDHLTAEFRDADLGSPLHAWLPPEMTRGLYGEDAS